MMRLIRRRARGQMQIPLAGHIPGRPHNLLGLADTLRHHGLPARAARNTTMPDALVDLLAMVIADLLSIHPGPGS